MCFGPTASFVSSGLLIGAGVASLRIAPRGGSQLLASFPLLFGFHQGIEGAIWLQEGSTNPDFLKTIFILIYELIAFTLWPIVCPLSILLLDPPESRRPIIKFICGAGILLSLYLVYFIAIGPLTISTNGCSIQYDNIVPFPELTAFVYLLITSGPFLLTAQKYLRAFGVLGMTGWIATIWINEYTFISIWCFTTALLSLVLYLHFRETTVHPTT